MPLMVRTENIKQSKKMLLCRNVKLEKTESFA